MKKPKAKDVVALAVQKAANSVVDKPARVKAEPPLNVTMRQKFCDMINGAVNPVLKEYDQRIRSFDHSAKEEWLIQNGIDTLLTEAQAAIDEIEQRVKQGINGSSSYPGHLNVSTSLFTSGGIEKEWQKVRDDITEVQALRAERKAIRQKAVDVQNSIWLNGMPSEVGALLAELNRMNQNIIAPDGLDNYHIVE